MKWLWMLGLLATTASAQTKLDSLIPPATPFVTDAARLFAPNEITAMNDVARRTQATIGGDIAVLTLTDIHDYLPAEVAMTAGRQWRVGGSAAIGSEQRNLGVVILIVPRTANHGGKCFIGTGRGAEGFITDSKAGTLCRDNRTLFQASKYGEATLNLVTSVSALMQEHVSPPVVVPADPMDPTTIIWAVFIISGLFICGLLLLRRQRRLQEEEDRRTRAMWAAHNAKVRRQAEEQRRQAEARAAEAARKEKARWDALTPEEQAAEIAFRKEQEWKAAKQREINEEKARVRRLKEEKARREREDEEDERRRRSSYSTDTSYYGSSSSDSSSSSSDSFGGGGGFSGGGGGSDF
jgi:uncharacterized membrane protein YgcG